MKAVMMGCSPRECCNILNYIQSILARKKFPKDYKGWVYIYCTKDRKDNLVKYYRSKYMIFNKLSKRNHSLNGKVVARFYCDKVGIIHDFLEGLEETESFNRHITISNEEELLKQTRLTIEEIEKYGGTYAIHISQLEIFDKPKELSEFRKPYTLSCDELNKIGLPIPLGIYNTVIKQGKYFIAKAPSNYCYVEVEE